jgi:hypothetical protein
MNYSTQRFPSHFIKGECHHLARRVCALTISVAGALELREDGDFSKSKN